MANTNPEDYNEITIHTWTMGEDMISVMDQGGRFIVPHRKVSDVPNLESQLLDVCAAHGGNVFHEKNTFGQYKYLNGPNPSVYSKVVANV